MIKLVIYSETPLVLNTITEEWENIVYTLDAESKKYQKRGSDSNNPMVELLKLARRYYKTHIFIIIYYLLKYLS